MPKTRSLETRFVVVFISKNSAFGVRFNIPVTTKVESTSKNLRFLKTYKSEADSGDVVASLNLAFISR